VVIDRLNAAIIKILQLPEVRRFMVNDGAEPAFNTPDEFTAYLRADHAKWAKVIKSAGLRDSQ